MLAQFFFQSHAFPEDARDSSVSAVVSEHDSHSLLPMLVGDNQQDRSQHRAGDTGEDGHTPPALVKVQAAEDQEGVTEGQVDAAQEDRDNDGGRQAQHYHRGELSGVEENVSEATSYYHQ